MFECYGEETWQWLSDKIFSLCLPLTHMCIPEIHNSPRGLIYLCILPHNTIVTVICFVRHRLIWFSLWERTELSTKKKRKKEHSTKSTNNYEKIGVISFRQLPCEICFNHGIPLIPQWCINIFLLLKDLVSQGIHKQCQEPSCHAKRERLVWSC